ncbi:MAG: cell division protein FtsH, partial [Elainella sp.]
MQTAARSQSTYATLIDRVKACQVEQVTIHPRRIDYDLKSEFGGQQYYTQPGGPVADLTALLLQHNVK